MIHERIIRIQQNFRRHGIAQLLVAWSLLVFASSFAHSYEWEPYSVRPHISAMKAKPHDLSASWKDLRAAHFSFVAELLELYPDREIYFLARDAELLYDTAYLVAKPDERNRLHLINISRANMHAQGVTDYLEQNGISNQALKNGKKVLLVDTGFAGTISNTISEYLEDSAKLNLKTHLIASTNFLLPSSRTFLVHINPAANESSPSQMTSTIVNYEYLPRFTDRARVFDTIDGVIEPMSLKGTGESSDGTVDKILAAKYMEDIKFYWSNNKGIQQDFYEERDTVKKIIQLLISTHLSKTVRISELKALIQESNKYEAIVRDILDADDKSIQLNIDINEDELGLITKRPGMSTVMEIPELIRRYPAWKSLFDNPEKQITNLFSQGDVQTIGAILDSVNNFEVRSILLKQLGLDHGPQMNFRLQKIIRTLIVKSDPVVLRALAEHVFSQPHSAEMKDLLKLLIEKGDQSVLRAIAKFVFSQAHTKDMDDLVELLIRKGDRDTQMAAANSIFSKVHTKFMTKQLRLLIENADAYTLMILASSTFSQAHTKDMTDLLRLVIEMADKDVLGDLRSFTFSQPHTEHMTALRESLGIKDRTKRIEFLKREFDKPDNSTYLKIHEYNQCQELLTAS